VSKLVSMV